MGISLIWKKKLFPIVLVSNLEKLIAMLSRTSSSVFGVLIYLHIYQGVSHLIYYAESSDCSC